jgi:serine/threonine-protein kinase
MVARNLTPEAFVELLSGNSEGNFMYLRHVLPAIERGDMKQFGVENLPRGLFAYYREHWAQMQVKDRDVFDAWYQPVLCVLAAAREPVPIGYLVKWAKIKANHVQRVLETWHEFLFVERGADRRIQYQIYHDTFRDFLSTYVDPGLRSAREKIIQSGRQSFGRKNPKE